MLWHDLRRVATALRRHRRERKQPSCADLGIAWVEAAGRDEQHRHLRRYRAAITDMGPQSREVRLTFEQWSVAGRGEPAQRLSYMSMDLSSLPVGRRELTWLTDGRRILRAFSGSESLRSHMEAGSGPRGSRWAATLGLWHAGERVDQVTIFERQTAGGP